ncbi:MAG TPA: DUF3616 domain-containing protein [Gemmatimonadaceae bacterium]|nr:DUF3616 domain-containing protein [Gemmatimonadaceae bacterium]
MVQPVAEVERPPASRRGQGVIAAAAGAAVVAIGAAIWLARMDPGMDSGALPVIAGGLFEASGVAHVPGTNQLLFVDDGQTREIFMMELGPDGKQEGESVRIPLAADVTDLEGITSDGRHFYVVGSQSKLTGFDGDGLVRFTFDPKTSRAERVEPISGLKAWLAANVPELRGTDRTIGDHVLNIEAIAWDPRNDRLLLGLRAPVIDGHALIVPIRLTDSSAAFRRENLRLDGATIRVDLEGAGIRGLEYDQAASAFRLITGASLNEETLDFRLTEWDGISESAVRDIATFPRTVKPEGSTRAALGGRPVTVIVFDVGRFTVTD